jgi:protein SCO1/2
MVRKASLTRPLIIVVIIAAAATAAAISAGRLLTPPSFHGSAYEPAPAASDFTLTDQTGQPLALHDLRGKTVFLFFGYTHCPDVCPLTLAKLDSALKTAGATSDDARVVMISVDPAQDTPAALAEYLERYGPAFVGLTGAPHEIARIANDYGVHTNPEAPGAMPTHTAAIFGIDREGRLRVLMRPESSQKELTSDVRALLHS